MKSLLTLAAAIAMTAATIAPATAAIVHYTLDFPDTPQIRAMGSDGPYSDLSRMEFDVDFAKIPFGVIKYDATRADQSRPGFCFWSVNAPTVNTFYDGTVHSDVTSDVIMCDNASYQAGALGELEVWNNDIFLVLPDFTVFYSRALYPDGPQSEPTEFEYTLILGGPVSILDSLGNTFKLTAVEEAVPEPATLALFAIGVAAMTASRRRRPSRIGTRSKQ